MRSFLYFWTIYISSNKWRALMCFGWPWIYVIGSVLSVFLFVHKKRNEQNWLNQFDRQGFGALSALNIIFWYSFVSGYDNTQTLTSLKNCNPALNLCLKRFRKLLLSLTFFVSSLSLAAFAKTPGNLSLSLTINFSFCLNDLLTLATRAFVRVVASETDADDSVICKMCCGCW